MGCLKPKSKMPKAGVIKQIFLVVSGQEASL